METVIVLDGNSYNVEIIYADKNGFDARWDGQIEYFKWSDIVIRGRKNG